MTATFNETLNPEAEALFYPIRDRLVKERRRLGITQKAVARYCGVSTVHMNRIELGRVHPSSTMLYSWCAALGYDPQIVLKKSRWGPLA